ncbi:hypothetical protein [Flavihumibacter sp.]|uniref:hypothetical protein n=1 Tax=Flavihumibacter sp. TaxID=1913981 RepID=UPI002FC5D883
MLFRSILALAIIGSVALSSCSRTVIVRKGPPHRKHFYHMPPGHAKKVYGTKSAKPFAPGQRKKKH